MDCEGVAWRSDDEDEGRGQPIQYTTTHTTHALHGWMHAQVTTVSMGNPHAVIFVPFLDAVDLNTLGPKFETHPAFPKKTNTEFVQVRAVWGER